MYLDMHFPFTPFVLVLLIALIGCSRPSEDEAFHEWEASFYDGQNHPQLEKLPYPVELPERPPSTEQAAAELRAHIERLMESDPVVVGDGEGGDSVLFGRIENVSSDGRNIFVSDVMNSRVVALASDGSLVDAFGRPGEGPGEFKQVYDVFPDDDGVIVLDAPRRFSLWTRSEEGFELEEHRTYPMVTRSACRLGGDFIVHAPVPGRGLIHVFNREGEEVDVFGELYRSENPLVADIMSSAEVACVDDSETIVLAFTGLSMMTAFSREGDVLWSVPTLDVPPTRHEVTKEGRSIGHRKEGSERDIGALTYHAGYGLILTVYNRDGLYNRDNPASALAYDSYDVYLVDVDTGAMERIATLPGVLEVITDSLVVLSASESAPIVSIYRTAE